MQKSKWCRAKGKDAVLSFKLPKTAKGSPSFNILIFVCLQLYVPDQQPRQKGSAFVTGAVDFKLENKNKGKMRRLNSMDI